MAYPTWGARNVNTVEKTADRLKPVTQEQAKARRLKAQAEICVAVAFLAALPVFAAEQGALHDVGGRVTALLSDAGDVEIASNVVAVLPNGKRVRLTGKDARREARGFAWSQDFELPDGGHGTLNLKAEEDAAGLHYTTAVAAESTLDVDAIEFVVDLPRHDPFVHGTITQQKGMDIVLALTRHIL